MSIPYTLSSESVALVTASSAGLGAATARALARSGIRVVINYCSSKDKAEKLLEDLEHLRPDCGDEYADKRPRFLAIMADVSRRAELSRLIEEAVHAMGRLDLVVSNHGWTKMRDFHDLDDNVEETDWDTCFNMNVKSHLFLFYAARKHLEAAAGSFITTASLAGVKPSGSSVV
ncbi:hypothetical protein EG329_013336 [Mollisiaceae sp. DMI_Dod_QoI]|nr:hypothetical protein EG329_013336 [Helotiales sp. DMI_Dod_QoI]